ncbi:hypothetical protein [Thauera sp. AutoDN2]|uniref:hypothetical protein n=1 Tax=Thauera sp. AutoDN2 TaxID=3416051 RepID=UPI003F4BDCA1
MRTTATGTPTHALPHGNIIAEYPLDTAQFAARQGIKTQSLRVRLSRTGHYFGVRPLRLANRLLRWPDVTVAAPGQLDQGDRDHA